MATALVNIKVWVTSCNNHISRPALNEAKAINFASDMLYHDKTCKIEVWEINDKTPTRYEVVMPGAPTLRKAPIV